MLKSPQRNQTLTSSIRSVMKSTLANLIGVKCAQCSLIYPQDMIEEHLITHIQPKYLMPHQQNSGAKKLSSSIQFTEQTLSVDSADLPSLNMHEFPQQERIRKDIQAPSQFAIVHHNLPALKKDIVSYRGDQRDLSSRLNGFVEQDTFEQMILTQNIDLGHQSRQIRPQQVAVYRSAMLKKGPEKYNIRSEKKVNPFQQTPEKSKQYEIVPIYEDMKSTSSEEQIDKRLLTVNIKKHREATPRRQQINTSAKKMPQTAQTFLEYSSVQASSPSVTRFAHHHHDNDYECEYCHGFYCRHCKSTIPPQYRPSNMTKELDPKIVDFYKKHVYKGDCEECERNVR